MQNDYTTAIKKEDVKKIIDLSHHEAVVIDFTALEGVAPAAAEGVPAQKPAKSEQPAKKQAAQ